MENPCVALLDEPENSKFDEAAVFMPMTTPRIVTSGPPESPGWIGALVWMSPESCSDVPLDWSDAVIDWFRAVMVPAAVLGVPPAPPALPMPITDWPTEAVRESPRFAVARPEAF